MIVDSIQQLQHFNSKAVFLYPILRDLRVHSKVNTVIGFVVIDLETRNAITISNNHPEGIWHTNNLEFLNNSIVYCYNTIALKYAGYDTSKYIDVMMQYYLYTNTGYTTTTPNIIQHYTRVYPNCYRINELVSLCKHEQIAQEILQECWVKELQPGLSFYQDELLTAFHKIETNGIAVNGELFANRFGSTLSLVDKKSYTQYNYYTATGRPSNRFGGINFAALNKEDDTRSCFVSSHEQGCLVEIDFNSYHPRLIAQLIGYDFGTDNVYEHLASHYHNTPNPTPQQIESAKEGTFRQLYGGIQQQYLHIPFFSRTNEIARYLWKTAEDLGYVESPISGRRLMLSNHSDMNMNTLFNYFIQMYETEMNVIILNKIHELLQSHKTKPVLYTYDSILFDVELSELDYLLRGVVTKAIDLEKFPIKIKRGDNYKSLALLQ